MRPGKPAVIWADDPKSEEVIERCSAPRARVMTVGRKGETIRLVEQTPTPLGQALLLEHGGKTSSSRLPLIGAYQAANVLTAAGLVIATGGDWRATFSRDAARRARAWAARTRGDQPRRRPVYVDYAHTPDALEAAIAALRPHVEGRLITVFGAGGDRDQGKRPEMGAVATRIPTS